MVTAMGTRPTQFGGLVLGVALALLVLNSAVAPSSGGDKSIQLGFESETTELEPGEQAELHVVASTDGGSDGEGVQNSSLRLVYPGEHLDVVAVEPGGFMRQSPATLQTDSRVNNSVGVLEFDQDLPDARNGVTGTEYFAHVTVEVDEDAPASTLEINFDEPYFELAVTGAPLAYYTEPGEIAVAGGGERVEPATPETVDLQPLSDDSASDSGTDADGTGKDDGTADDAAAGESTDDDGSGLGVLAGAVGLVAVSLLVATRVLRGETA